MNHHTATKRTISTHGEIVVSSCYVGQFQMRLGKDGRPEVFWVVNDPPSVESDSRPTPVKRPRTDAATKTDTTHRAIEAKPSDKKEEPPTLQDGEVGEECTICYEGYRNIDDKWFLRCAHCFHKKCVDQWLAVDNSCPLCRISAEEE